LSADRSHAAPEKHGTATTVGVMGVFE